MQNIKLAIIIPFFKIRFFEETIKSLSNQTNKKFNVYIGNDASNDNPVQLLKKYNLNNLNYTYFESNLGSKGKLVEQWERCIDLSNDEEWIMILADDDFISDNFVETFYKHLEKTEQQKISLLRFKMRRISENSEFLINHLQPRLQKGEDYVWDDETGKRFISISENIFTRKIYEKYRFRRYPLAWRTDVMMYLDFSNNNNVLGINDAFVAVRRSDIQLTRRRDMDNYKLEAQEYFYKDLLLDYGDKFNKSQKLRFLKYYYFYQNETELDNSITYLFYKYGGLIEFLKFSVKKVLKI